MKSCYQITRLLSDAQERKLSWKENLTVRVHITMCSGCRNFANQMPVLRQIARQYAKGHEDNTETDNN